MERDGEAHLNYYTSADNREKQLVNKPLAISGITNEYCRKVQ